MASDSNGGYTKKIVATCDPSEMAFFGYCGLRGGTRTATETLLGLRGSLRVAASVLLPSLCAGECTQPPAVASSPLSALHINVCFHPVLTGSKTMEDHAPFTSLS